MVMHSACAAASAAAELPLARFQNSYPLPAPGTACPLAVGTVSELDPDAPGRQGKALHVDNAKAEDRLMLRMWQLIRAGDWLSFRQQVGAQRRTAAHLAHASWC